MLAGVESKAWQYASFLHITVALFDPTPCGCHPAAHPEMPRVRVSSEIRYCSYSTATRCCVHAVTGKTKACGEGRGRFEPREPYLGTLPHDKPSHLR